MRGDTTNICILTRVKFDQIFVSASDYTFLIDPGLGTISYILVQ